MRIDDSNKAVLSREVLDAVERPRSDRLSAAIELSLQRGGAGAAGDQRTVQVAGGRRILRTV